MKRIGRLFLAAVVTAFSVSSPAFALAILQTESFGGSTYHLLDRSLFPAAEAQANSLGGNLVTIESSEENQFIVETFGPTAAAAAPTSIVSLWTGLNDVNVEGSFSWTSGLPVTYTNWHTTEPAGNFPDEDYGAIFIFREGGFFIPVGKWHDVVADERFNEARFGIVEVIPEPSTVLLVLLGGVALSVRRQARSL